MCDGDARELIRRVVDRIADPYAVFGSSPTSGHRNLDMSHASTDVYSRHNGSAGVLYVLGKLRPEYDVEDALERYARHVRENARISLTSSWPFRKEALLALHEVALVGAPSADSSQVADALCWATASTATAETASLRRQIIQHGRVASFATYDVISGLARTIITLCRWRRPEDFEVIARGAMALTELLPRQNLDVSDSLVWVDSPPFATEQGAVRPPVRHINLGTAHGLTGVLVSVSIAIGTLQDSRYRDHSTLRSLRGALRRAAEVMVAERQEKGALPMFLYASPVGQLLRSDVQLRPSWCYSDAGFGMALLSVARVAPDTGLDTEASAILSSAFSADRLDLLADTSLCHGLAGALEMVAAAGESVGPADAVGLQLACQSKILESARKDSPYAIGYGIRPEESDPAFPGLLNGAAGAALALAHVNGLPPSDGINQNLAGADPWI